MDFAQPSNPVRDLGRIGTVVILHALLGYALLNGMANKVVAILKKPLDVALIEEFKPPPAPKVETPVRRVTTPPPAYVPPQEVSVAAPSNDNAIAATTTVQPVVETVVAAPVPKPVPATIAVGLVCANHLDVRSRLAFPAQAQRMGLSGDVLVEFTLSARGEATDIRVIKSTHPLFNDAAVAAVSQLRCAAQGQDMHVRVPFAFRLER